MKRNESNVNTYISCTWQNTTVWRHRNTLVWVRWWWGWRWRWRIDHVKQQSEEKQSEFIGCKSLTEREGVAAKWWVYLWETVTTTKCSMYIYTYVYCWQLGRGIPLNENTWQTDESSSHLSYVYTCVCMYVLWRFDDHTLTITSTFIKNERAHERNNTAARVTNTPPPTLTASLYSFVVEIKKKSRHFCGV